MAKKPQTAMTVTFGGELGFSSNKNITYDVSDDKQAFEIRFDTALAAGVGSPSFDGLEKTDAPVNTRIFSAVIPATGKTIKTSFVVNGFGNLEPGCQTVLLLTVNDKDRVAHFSPTKTRDQDAFTFSLPYQAKSVSDFRLTLVLVAEHDSAHADASALIAVTDISADAAFSKKKVSPTSPKKSARKKTRK